MGRKIAPWLGLLSGCVIVLGCVGSVWLPQVFIDLPGVLWLRQHLRVIARFLVGVGVVGQIAAFVLLRPVRGQLGRPRLILALWSLPYLIAPPILSRDMYAYLDQGWMVKVGINPYTEGMGTRSPFLLLVDDYWRTDTTIYPPLALEIQRVIVDIGQLNPLVTVLLMRIPTFLALALIAYLLPKLAKALPGTHQDLGRVLWLGLLNPITVIHGLGGGHNDTWMVAAAMFAVWMGTQRHWGYWAGTVFAGVAASIKQPAMMSAVVIALVAKPSKKFSRRVIWSALAVIIAVGVFVAITLATGLGFGWVTASGSPTKAYTQAPVNIVRQAIVQVFHAPDKTVYGVVTVIGILILLFVLLYHWGKLWHHPLNLGGWGYTSISGFSPTLQVWYLSSSIVFLAIMRLSRLWASVLALWACELLISNWMTEILGWSNFNAFFMSWGLLLPVAWVLWKSPGNILEPRHRVIDLTDMAPANLAVAGSAVGSAVATGAVLRHGAHVARRRPAPGHYSAASDQNATAS